MTLNSCVIHRYNTHKVTVQVLEVISVQVICFTIVYLYCMVAVCQPLIKLMIA